MQRALSLSKYLPNFGFQVHVLKAGNAGGPVYDAALLRQVPASITVHEAFTPEIPFALRQKLWARLAGKSSPGTPNDAKAASGFSIKRWLAKRIKRVLCPEPEILGIFALRKARQIIKREKIDCVLVTVQLFRASGRHGAEAGISVDQAGQRFSG